MLDMLWFYGDDNIVKPRNILLSWNFYSLPPGSPPLLSLGMYLKYACNNRFVAVRPLPHVLQPILAGERTNLKNLIGNDRNWWWYILKMLFLFEINTGLTWCDVFRDRQHGWSSLLSLDWAGAQNCEIRIETKHTGLCYYICPSEGFDLNWSNHFESSSDKGCVVELHFIMFTWVCGGVCWHVFKLIQSLKCYHDGQKWSTATVSTMILYKR